MDILLYLFPIVILAGVLRGYSGFGFAVIAVMGLNLFLAPVQSVPIVLALDIICSLSLTRQALKQAHLPTFKMLVLGSIIGIPIGLVLLSAIPANILKLIICLLVVIFVILLAFNKGQSKQDSAARKLILGIASGLGTSSSSIGGPMVLYYMLSSPLDVKAQRATMILFFIFIDVFSLLGLTVGGLSTQNTFYYLAWLVLPTLMGVKIGQYFFNKKPPRSFKLISLPLMLLTAVIGFVQGIHSF